MDRRKLYERLTSRKFLAPIAYAILLVLNDLFELGISGEIYWPIAIAIIAFVAGESYVDSKAVVQKFKEYVYDNEE